MQSRRAPSSPYTIAWLLVVTTLVVLVAVWASALTHTVGSAAAGKETIPTPKGSAASSGVIPAIVTDYTHDGTAAPTALCNQLSPTPDVVTVETPNGKVLEMLHCRVDGSAGGTAQPSVPAPGACLYIESPDGGQIVLNAKTGSVLSTAQATHCQK